MTLGGEFVWNQKRFFVVLLFWVLWGFGAPSGL